MLKNLNRIKTVFLLVKVCLFLLKQEIVLGATSVIEYMCFWYVSFNCWTFVRYHIWCEELSAKYRAKMLLFSSSLYFSIKFMTFRMVFRTLTLIQSVTKFYCWQSLSLQLVLSLIFSIQLLFLCYLFFFVHIPKRLNVVHFILPVLTMFQCIRTILFFCLYNR